MLPLALFLCAGSAYAASLSLSPATGVYTAGGTFTARVVVNTAGASINAADGTLSFNPKELTVIGITKGTIFSLWTAEPSYSNSNGSITFSGGSPSGYSGSGGTVLTVSFKANAAGSPKVSFTSGSVLAADGKGTNVLTSMNGGSFTVTAAASTPAPEVVEYVPPANTPGAPQIKSSTHPDSDAWYAAKNAALSWDLPAGVSAVRTLLDGNASAIPTKVYDEPITHIDLADLDEGVSYFHLQFKNADGWGKVAHYRLAVDSEKPDAFDISLPEGADLSNPIQTLRVAAHDATSAVRRFKVQIDGKDPIELSDETGSSTITLPALEPGYHTTVIEAFDEAGNSIIGSFSFTISSFDKPMFTEYPSQINEEVIPVIKGTTRPNAAVTVTLAELGLGVSAESSVKKYELQSDGNGEFVFIPDGRLSEGVYELTAVATDQYGAKSGVSEPIRIAVEQPGYIRIGSFVVSVLSVVVPLFALLILFFLGLWFLFLRLRSLRRGVSREAHEALAILSSEFSALQEALSKQKEALEKARKTGKLTKAESTLFTEISAALDASRKRVSKEVSDVEDLVE
jgi:hypothetical protein